MRLGEGALKASPGGAWPLSRTGWPSRARSAGHGPRGGARDFGMGFSPAMARRGAGAAIPEARGLGVGKALRAVLEIELQLR
jgi:hypothetical protein